jgi:CheY-like chemotaxis protein
MTETSEQTPSKRKVIVVDDDQVIANAFTIILNQAGFETRAVFSGEQAIELLESFQPEMLIADVVMSGMTGIEAAIAIRNRLPKCNILLFSGQVLRAMEKSLRLPPHAPAASWNTLRKWGNLSSVSVLTVMQDFLSNRPLSAGCYSMILSMGPAFCTELFLLQW